MFVCEVCNSANCSYFETGDCHICSGRAAKTPEMIKKAAELLSQQDAEGFSISTKIPKEWLVNEEDLWDRKMCERTQSVKNYLNKRISQELQKATGLPYVNDGDCRIVFDYKKGEVSSENNELFVFGRYRKHVAGLSQSRWICSKCSGKGCGSCSGKGKNYESVEERIGDPFKRAAEAADYVLHASGREDVDATNSAGRAFVLEIKNPAKRRISLEGIAKEIEKTNEVTVQGLKVVSRRFVEVVTESHFDKTYVAEVEFGKEITSEDIKKAEGIAGQTVLQRTPKRVAHRRADLVRHRKVKSIRVISHEGKNASIKIRAEAGTYIKELISGDEGRTNPSIAGILSAEAKCTKLEVTEIDDGYLDFCL